MDNVFWRLLTILLLNILGVFSSHNDIDVIYLQVHNSTSNTAEIPIVFNAFGETIELKLQRNDKLLAPYFQVWLHNGPDMIEEISQLSNTQYRHYLHQDGLSTAAMTFYDDGVHGLVLLDNITLEITPMDQTDRYITESTLFAEKTPHIVKRSRVSSLPNYFKMKKSYSESLNDVEDLIDKKSVSTDEVTVELAVFFDEPGYKLFSPFFNRDERKIRDMLLAYVNAVQALFYHPSLGTRVNIALVRLDIMKQQPTTLPHHNGERLKLLNSFCNYSSVNNPTDDDHPNHWDMGLYVSGLDFYAIENGKKDGLTMGLATVSGVCLHQYSCVIVELGVTNRFGKPYPSAGFTSVYIAAHEIGHNLGMHHDSTDNSCARDGYIMSPSRGTQGETIWSPCSRDVALNLARKKHCLLDKTPMRFDKTLDHTRFLTLPGREWTAKRQCELLLKDRDASIVTLNNACQALQCKSPHRSGYYFAGPALDGTICDDGKECRGGVCLPALHFFPVKPTTKRPSTGSVNKGWSKWREETCKSGCIRKSRGWKIRRRVCNNNNNNRVYENDLTTNDCIGPAYDVKLCKDEKLCKKRITAEEYATMKCGEFSVHLSVLDKDSSGLQAPHEVERPWMACAIFCRRQDIASYYTPRIELNDLGIDPYFPDGTWCHNEDNEDYFCRQRHCLPGNFRFAKDILSRNNNTDDVDLGPQNARPDGYKIPDILVRYHSLGNDGLPLSKTLLIPDVTPAYDEWVNNDYIEIPLDN